MDTQRCAHAAADGQWYASVVAHVPPVAWIDSLRSLARARLGASLAIETSWPHACERDEVARWTRGTGVWLHAEPFDAPELGCALWMESSLALEIVDRALGGEGGPFPSAHAASRLSEAEQGALAYVAVRALSEADCALRLHGVDTHAPPIAPGWICWPARVRLGEHVAAVRFWAPPMPAAGRAGSARRPLDTRWVLAAEPLEPAPLGPGDVVVLEASGARPADGWLRLVSLEALLPVRHRGGALVARPGRLPHPSHVHLEVQGPPFTLDQLVAMARGEAQPHALSDTTAWLMHQGRCLASGPLVTLDGSLGLRITHVRDTTRA